MSDTNCFYCGEPEETDTPTGITIYRCGTLIYPNGSFVTTLICELGRDLRREREAHNNTKRERDEAREIIKKLDETILEMSPRHINSVTMCGRYPCWMVWLPKNGRVERKSLSAAVLEFIDQLKEGAK
jgi:hypothetical protein